MSERTIAGPMELRHGRWQDVLADVPAAWAIITDPPYSERTHSGQRTGGLDDAGKNKQTIGYDPITEHECNELAALSDRIKAAWCCVFCDHETAVMHRHSMAGRGFYVCAPVRWIKPDAPPRFSGDGPACTTEDIVVARESSRRPMLGTTSGHYIFGISELRGCGVAGAKPVGLMRALIREYTRPGDLVVDPYAGTGTTLLAAAMEGRRAIGAEMDAGRYALAARRLRKGYTPDFFSAA